MIILSMFILFQFIKSVVKSSPSTRQHDDTQVLILQLMNKIDELKVMTKHGFRKTQCDNEFVKKELLELKALFANFETMICEKEDENERRLAEQCSNNDDESSNQTNPTLLELNEGTTDSNPTPEDAPIKNVNIVEASEEEIQNLTLHRAADSGLLDVVEKLISDGAEINEINNNNETALMRASLKCHLPVVKFLLDKGADINIQNKNEETALHLAVIGADLNVVKLLAEKGADLFKKNMWDSNPKGLADSMPRKEISEFLSQAMQVQANN